MTFALDLGDLDHVGVTPGLDERVVAVSDDVVGEELVGITPSEETISLSDGLSLGSSGLGNWREFAGLDL